MNLALNNLQRLICHKTKQTKPKFIDSLMFSAEEAEKEEIHRKDSTVAVC